MSGQDERAKQFKEAAESKLTGDQLVKEITTLRRFLFRNQEYRFTKAAQSNLYMAILAHNANPAASEARSAGEPPILKLLDDALKMPFTVFTSAQKDRLLQLYWAVLGEDGEDGKNGASKNAVSRTEDLVLLDMEEDGNTSLMREDGSEYTRVVTVEDTACAAAMRKALGEGFSVVVTVSGADDDTRVSFVSYRIEEE